MMISNIAVDLHVNYGLEMFQQFSNNDRFSICNPIGTWYGGFKVDSQVACFLTLHVA